MDYLPFRAARFLPCALHLAIFFAPYFFRPAAAAMAAAASGLLPLLTSASFILANLPPPPGFRLLPLYFFALAAILHFLSPLPRHFRHAKKIAMSPVGRVRK